MMAQDLMMNGHYRSINNIAFDYNKTDNNYNASNILINDWYFIALQEPDDRSVNTFFKLLINHRVSILVRLKPENEFNKLGSVKYWKNRIENNKLIINDFEAIKSSEKVAIPYYYSNIWVDDKGVYVEELYNLVQTTRRKYHSLDLYSPIACHCASEVGRTGTFIAAFVLAEYIDKNKDLNNLSIEEIVIKLA